MGACVCVFEAESKSLILECALSRHRKCFPYKALKKEETKKTIK